MKPYIYTIMKKEKLAEILTAFHACMMLPIQVIDRYGAVLISEGAYPAYCSHILPFLPQPESCMAIHADAGKRAMEIGETYIFSCHSNLNHIAFPLINHETLFGSVLVGPFLMAEPDSELIISLSKRYPTVPTDVLIELYEDASHLPIISPATVTQISRLLYYLFSNFVNDAKQELVIKSKQAHQQSRINDSIQKYKNMGFTSSTPYPYDKEKLLLTKVKTGNRQAAGALLNDILGYVYFSEGSNLDMLKVRGIELCSLLSRTAIDGGANPSHALKMNSSFITNIEKVKSADSLCYALQEVLDACIDYTYSLYNKKNSDIIRKAMNYISDHFSEQITLEEVASFVHLNPSYFSSFFKQACGFSFKEYLNMVRVEESKRLLANTDYPLIDIAVATGFENHSYFTKVFRQHTGITPKQYRK